jgi:hypothetical protein
MNNTSKIHTSRYLTNQNTHYDTLENDKMHLNVSLLTSKNLKFEIQNLKKTLEQKKEFLSSYYKNEKVFTKRIYVDKDKENIPSIFHKKNDRGVLKTLIITSDMGNIDHFDNENAIESEIDKNKLMSTLKNTTIMDTLKTTKRENNSTSTQSLKINKPSTTYINESEKRELKLMYKNIFDKKYTKLIESFQEKTLTKEEEKRREIRERVLKIQKKPDYIKEKIKDMKTKLYFMKSVYDYSYPLIMIKKVQAQKKVYDLCIDDYNKKISMKNQLIKNGKDKDIKANKFNSIYSSPDVINSETIYNDLIKDKLKASPLKRVKRTQSLIVGSRLKTHSAFAFSSTTIPMYNIKSPQSTQSINVTRNNSTLHFNNIY